MKEVTTKEMLNCVKRELAMRHRVYPRWVDQGQMDISKAGREIEVMKAIVAHFAKLHDQEQGGLDLGI